MIRRRGISMVATVVLLSVVCVSAASASTSATAVLKSEALSIAQMPKGWTAQQPTYNLRMGCLSQLLEPKGVTRTHLVEVHYQGKGDVPQLIETLTTYNNTPLAYRKIAAASASCKRVSGTLKGYPVTGTVRTLALARQGNESVAYLIAMAGQHLRFQADYVIARKGNVVVTVIEGNVPTVNLTQFRNFVSTAVARVK
ncbi:MAG: hypothetical protein KGL23_00705 [Acidobacteriota bacterium]|nr:hypothetical protein [Acidobacteriota bacterium]MDE3093634.1 hypothetical protein [Acidobacteriota bacterium]MDE3138521.1 hypothetical protein [Acidobacteriota bacterium]MDE3145940.1 hypothetical protein [Acidobacteriota bacterium]